MMSRVLLYACSEGLDLMGEALLLPWGFWYLVHHSYLEGHWGAAIMRYGALLSVQATGRLLGRACSPPVVSTSDLTRPQHLFGMLLLAASAVVLCMTNRYGLMLLAYFGFGFAGATIVGTHSTASHSLVGGLSLGGDFDHALGSNSVSGVAALRSVGLHVGTGSFGAMPYGSLAHADTESASRSAILIFMFVSLVSGFLYGESGSFSHHSAFAPCVFFALACLLCASLYVSSNRIAYKRAQWSCRLCYMCCEWIGGVGRGRSGGGGGGARGSESFGARCWGAFVRVLSYLPKEPRRGTTDSTDKRGAGAGSGAGTGSGRGDGSGEAADGRGIDDSEAGLPLLAYSGPVPSGFLSTSNGDEAQARKIYSATLRWRQDWGVDALMAAPQGDFFQILDLYPHAVHGLSLDGCVVVYESLGRARPRELTEAGISPARLVWHFILRNEYILRRVAAAGAGAGAGTGTAVGAVPDLAPYASPLKLMTVLDVQGIALFGSITPDVISFIKQSAELMDLHYPGVVQRLVICNAPSWFYQTWSFIARVLPESVRKKVDIIHDAAGLDKYISPSQRPVAYGGSDVPLGRHAFHAGFLRLADQWEAAGFAFEPGKGRAADQSQGQGQGLSAVSAVALEAGVGGATGARAAGSARSPPQSFPDIETPADEGEGSGGGDGENDDDEEFPDSSSGGGAGGLLGWVRSRFSKAPAPAPAAHLGEKNRFHFDEARGRWTLDVGSGSGGGGGGGSGSGGGGSGSRGRGGSDGGGQGDDDEDKDSYDGLGDGGGDESDEDDYNRHGTSGSAARSRGSASAAGAGAGAGAASKMTPAQLEEHGLVLAIQAAHLAATLGKKGAANGAGAGAGAGTGAGGGPGGGGRGSLLAALAKANRNRGAGSAGGGAGAGAGSGAGVGVSDSPDRAALNVLALVSSFYLLACLMQAGLVALLPVWLVLPPALGGEGYSVKDLAIVLSGSAVAALHAHIFLRPRVGRVAQASPVRALRTGAGSLTIACLAIPLLRQLIWLPSHTLLAIPLPAMLIVWAVWSANLARQSAGCLLSVAARACQIPSAVFIDSVGSLGDVAGPLLGALLFGGMLRLEGRYPLANDAAFLFTLTAVLASALYVGSLMLRLQFRGDFGIMPDEALALGPAERSRPLGSPSRRAARGAAAAAAGGEGAAASGSGGIAHLMSVSLGDLALLLGPVGRAGPYGARLFNLGQAGAAHKVS